MSLSLGAYKVQYLIQQLIPTPYAVNLETNLLTNNNLHQARFHKIWRYGVLLSMVLFAVPLILYRLLWLFFHWKYFTVNHVDQIIVHIFGLGAAAIFLPACYTIHVHNIEIQYIINQRCKIVPVIAEVTNKLNFFVTVPFLGKTSIFEIFIYGLSSVFLILVLGITTLPFAVSYEPVQWTLSSSSIAAKLLAAFIYFIYMTYAAVMVLSILLIIIVALEGIVSYSFKLHFYKCPYSNLMRLKFRLCYKRFRTLQIFIIIGNFILVDFLTTLIFVGVLAASSAAFMTLKMYSLLNIFMYLLGPAATILCLELALGLTYLANFPYKNTKVFKLYWKQFATSKENRRLLKACVPSGFNLGPYGVARALLGLHICDDIIRNTVTLLLLGPNIS